MSGTEQLYFHDPYVRSFDARVVDRVSISGGVRVALDRTAFYPEGGGQPADTGTLNGAPVTDVQSDGDVIWHVVEGSVDDVDVHGIIDWDRRFDHMQQHHGQHLLSAAFDNLFAVATTSFHLGRHSVTIDLATADLTETQIRAAETLANQIVWDDRPVHARFVNAAELAALPLRKPPAVEDNVRIVSVPDFDHSACGGTHPSRTGAVGLIFALRSERRGQETRVEFACGGRALALLRTTYSTVSTLSKELTVGVHELEETVYRLRDDEVAARKNLAAARKALTAYEAGELLAYAQRIGDVACVVYCSENQDGDHLQELALHLAGKGAFAILGAPSTPAHVILAGPESSGVQCGALLKRVMQETGGRGGGRSGFARGGVPNDKLETALELLETAVRDALGKADQ